MAKQANTALGIGLALALGLPGAALACSSSLTPDVVSVVQTQDRQTLQGRFVVVRGDPPPDSGRPSRVSYILTDKQQRRWTLVFDESVYTPKDSIGSFNGKDVEVEGTRVGENRLLVESIRLL